MTVVVAAGATTSVAANTKTADLVSGQFQNVGKGKLTLVSLPSAAGINCSLSIGGITLMNDLPIAMFGTTGTMSLSDNVVLSQVTNGGKIELYFRNTTGGALTVDYSLLFEPQ